MHFVGPGCGSGQAQAMVRERGGVFGKILRRHVIDDVVLTRAAYDRGELIGRHVHVRAYLSILISGHYTEVHDSETRSCAQWTAIYHPAGETHADYFHDYGDCLNLELSRRRLARLASRGFPQGVRVAATIGRGHAAALKFAEYSDCVDLPASERVTDDDLLSLFPGSGGAARAMPQWLLEAVQIVEAAHGRWTVDSLARDVGVHPSHFTRAFVRHLGMTPRQYRRRSRLEAAARALRTTRTPIADVAASCGFADQSHLTRSFREIAAMTPAQYRGVFGNAPRTERYSDRPAGRLMRDAP